MTTGERNPDTGDEPGLLRMAYEARGRQVAVLRAELADMTGAAELTARDAASHEREANAQRARAEGAEREAAAQRERADALDAAGADLQNQLRAARRGLVARSAERVLRRLRGPRR